MNLLWTVSNWKRTGPVEPSLDLARAMVARGHHVQIACGIRPAALRADESRNDTEDVVSAYGMPLAQTGARLDKHSAPLRDAKDVARLRAWLAANRPDAIVTTLRNDHCLLARAARPLGVPVVRLWFDDGSGRLKTRQRRALDHTAGVLVFGMQARRQLEEAGCPQERLVLSGAPLDIEQLRAPLSAPVAHERFRFGIVARMQTHRRFEMLWDAVARLHAENGPSFELMAIGRGTNQKTVAHDPVRELGLSSVVSFPGYLRGADYADTLASLDAQIFLVPGSDGTCRALREGMALGVPSITTARGMLPSIVEADRTGLVVDETAESLAQALDTLRRDPARARTMGEAARERAEAMFDVHKVAAKLEPLLVRGGPQNEV